MKQYNFELNYSRIKQLRIEKNITQLQMANVLGIQKPTYTQFENMKRNIFPITKFNQVANYFNVSMDYLLNLSDNPKIKIKNENLDAVEIGKRLKEIRIKNKLYQETLAMAIGTSKSLICEYEKGKKLLSLPYAYTICKKYNVSMDYLYGKVDKDKRC